ncbi:uncharacterized protein [Triticum aestivum]|uniref:uncharacterized protein n=1 Tax=Triticum aestivum TaxID=4565 RepID=UPI001D02492C|nr:uncharacterized protein LOC123057357 [Triticum aestivum]
MARGAVTGARRAMTADCDNAGTLTRRCCNQRERDTPGPVELHTVSAPGELRRRAALVSCDAAAKGEHEQSDPRRYIFFLCLRPPAGRRRLRPPPCCLQVVARRDVPPPFRTTTTTHQFLPWLLTAADKDHQTPLKLRCIFSKSTYRITSPPPCAARGNWVCRADATAVQYLTVDRFLNPSLHDPVTGQVTRLPRFQWDEGDPHGILYGDGTILLYSISHTDKGRKASFRASLLRPGDAKWTLVKRTLETPSRKVESCAAYHRGKIVVTVEGTVWRVITPDGDKASDVLVPKPSPPWEWQQGQGFFYTHQYSHVLESRGELLWVSVAGNGVTSQCGAPCLYVFVYTLEEEESTPEKMRWVRKDGHSLADRVLFLGSPNSFAVDASWLGGHGGCAYFVYHNNKNAFPQEKLGAFEYNFIEGKAEFVERLPPGWDGKKCTWLVPQPDIAPLQEINKRSLMAQEVKQQQAAIMVRHYEPSFTVLVRNLPLGMNSSQLRLFFSNHGKVSHAKLIYYNKTKTIEVTGLLTITMVHAHQKEALDALSGLSLDGCSLEVSLVKEKQRRRRHGRPLC